MLLVLLLQFLALTLRYTGTATAMVLLFAISIGFLFGSAYSQPVSTTSSIQDNTHRVVSLHWQDGLDWTNDDLSRHFITRPNAHCFANSDNLDAHSFVGVDELSSLWLWDSGAKHTYCREEYAPFVYASSIPTGINITTAGSDVLPCVKIGRLGKLPKVLVVARLTTNLLSVPDLLSSGTFIEIGFTTTEVIATLPDGSTAVVGTYVNGMYVVDKSYFGLDKCEQYHKRYSQRAQREIQKCSTLVSLAKSISVTVNNAFGTAPSSPPVDSAELVHNRLMGASPSTLLRIASRGLMSNFLSVKKVRSFAKKLCPSCVSARMTKLPFPKSADSRAIEFLMLVHADIFGPITPAGLCGSRYVCVLVDDYCRGMWILRLKHKSEMRVQLELWKAKVETKWSKILSKPVRVETIRSDNAGEFISKSFSEYLFNERVDHELSVPRCSPQNGVAERAISQLTTMVRHALISRRLEHIFWTDAFVFAAHLVWLMPTHANPGEISLPGSMLLACFRILLI